MHAVKFYADCNEVCIRNTNSFCVFYCLVNYNKKLMYSSLILCKIIRN